MKKFLLICTFLLVTLKIFGQQFSQYNTNTLYDSFENPSQRAFIPDSSKQFAFNFLLPNINLNFFLGGDAQATLKSRYFLSYYNNSTLKIGQGKFNRLNLNANAYLLMAKMFTSLNGDAEVGFSWQTKLEGRATISDESIGLLNGTGSFQNGNNYTNVLNDNYSYQVYHQFSLTYREKITKDFAFGAKLSLLLGIYASNLNITQSALSVDTANSAASLAAKGSLNSAYIPGNFGGTDLLPTFRSPGASISFGASYRTEDGFFIQGNVKDLGFIHWSSRSYTYNFDNSGTATGLNLSTREDSVYGEVKSLSHHNASLQSFTTATDGKIELSINKSFWLDDDKILKYSPTLIASKEFFYSGFVGALVNPIQYKNYVVTLTTTYDDLKDFIVGGQFMYKTPNIEVFVGSDKLAQSISIADNYISPAKAYTQNPSFTGASFFIGFALKFGPTIEHPMNASFIHTGEKGFLGRLIGRFFKTTD